MTIDVATAPPEHNDLVLSQAEITRPLSARERQAQINIIQELMRNNMKEKTHFGVVPGCKKPSLWKPGAELIAMTLRIALDHEPFDLSGPDDVRYRMRAVATSQLDQRFLGAAWGECWSLEQKYMWREAIVQKEWEETPVDRRRVKYEKTNDRNGFAEVYQVRTHAPDAVNTILKMAQKRAGIAVILMVTAASDIFTQDLEDLPREMLDSISEADRAGAVDATPPAEPQRASAAAATTTEAKKPQAAGLYVLGARVGKKTDTWTLYKIKTSDGVERATFVEDVYEVAVAAQESGKPISFEGKEDSKGFAITSMEVLS